MKKKSKQQLKDLIEARKQTQMRLDICRTALQGVATLASITAVLKLYHII